MAEPSDSSLAFFTKGTSKQWAHVYDLRPAAIRAKADQRSSKKGGPEEFLKLDNWYREKLPALIKSRKDFHLKYEELVQTAKWRLMMGKYRPKMLDLVRCNTETSVTGITRKAYKKISAAKNLQQAITMLVNLKGIGPSMASAVLSAAFPEEAPFMSDEGMLSTPGVEATDSTIAEYVNYSDALRNKALWLQNLDPEFKWTPHKVDQALWIYYVARDLKPELLDNLPRGEDEVSTSLNTSGGGGGGPSSDAADDNANDCTSSSLEPTTANGNYYGTNTTTSNNNNNNHHHIHHTSSQDSNSESASVPYSEEEFSQGGEASCSSSVTGPQDLSLPHHHALPILNGDSLYGGYSQEAVSTTTTTSGLYTTTSPPPATNGTNKRSIEELEESDLGVVPTHSTTNGNGTNNEDSCSKDDGLLDSEDSREANGQLLMMMTSATTTMTTSPSEENSIDGGVMCGVLGVVSDHDVDDEPSLKKQKTLELSSALAAATAEAE